MIGKESPPIRNAGFARAVIPAGQSIVALHMERDIAAGIISLTRKNSIEIELCYCSVFDACWVTRYSDGDASPVRACPD